MEGEQVAKNALKKLKSLKFRKRFRLTNTSEQSVIECIHALFAGQGLPEPEPGMAHTGETVGGTVVRPEEWMEGKTAKTSVFSGEKHTMGPRADDGPCADEGAQEEAGPTTMGALEEGAMTMAALEEAVRERLGLCWMRRAGRRPKPA